MKGINPGLLLLLGSLIWLSGCGAFTDPATRIAFGIESGARHLGKAEGSTYSIYGLSPERSDECTGPYTVQLDKVGALIVWCEDDSGNTLASGSTSHHSRFVTTPKTYIVKKPAGSTLTVTLVRRHGDAVITAVD